MPSHLTPQSPTAEDEAHKHRAERRDRWRLGVEVAALFVGIAGVIGLILTLTETQKATKAAIESAKAASSSAQTAREALELTEAADVTLDSIQCSSN